MALYDPPGDGQAQAGATGIACSGFVCPIKALEHARKILGRDADAGVRYPEASG
jgi:hypothetical protein